MNWYPKRKLPCLDRLSNLRFLQYPDDEIKLDSADVLQLAKEKYELKQGKGWATGYHFTLDNIDGTPT